MDLTKIEVIEALLNKYNTSLKRNFGQNFLIDRTVLETICENSDLSATDNIIEIGPGIGVLTQALASRAGHLTAYEIDSTMIKILKETLADYSNVTIYPLSGLQFIPEYKDFKIIANIPYNITGHFLKHIFQEIPYKPKKVVLMIQKEVAERICLDGTKNNLLSLSIKIFGSPHIIQYVSRDLFFPSPLVDSAILSIDTFPRPIIKSDISSFFSLVRHAFQQKRKKLCNVLKSYPSFKEHELSIKKKIDLNKRPEDLSIAEWDTMLQILKK